MNNQTNRELQSMEEHIDTRNEFKINDNVNENNWK